MAYSSSDLTNVENAIIALATGTRAVRVTINNKTVEYGQTDIESLRTLRAEIQRDVANNAGTARGYRYIQTGKGYD